MKRIVFVMVIVLSLFSCKENNNSTRTAIKLEIPEPLFVKQGEAIILDSKGMEISKFEIEISDTDYKRSQGLMYRKKMDNNKAMLFIFSNEQMRYFYMKNTLIPLDILYFDANKKLISIAREAKPLDETSLPSAKPAKYVLEINGGLAQKLNIKNNSVINFNIK